MGSAHTPRLTERELAVLGPLAEHRVLITPQIAALLGVSATSARRRIERLRERQLLDYGRILDRAPGAASITAPGLRLLGSPLPPPAVDLREYRHDVGVGWLSITARTGGFGKLSAIQTERVLRGSTRRRQAAVAAGTTPDPDQPRGVGLGLIGPHGNPQRHYPDLLLTTFAGDRVALELELTEKSSQRLDRIMTAYASDGRIGAVVYLLPNARLERQITAAARRAGASALIHVRRLSADPVSGVDEVHSYQRVRPAVRQAHRRGDRSGQEELSVSR